MTAVLDAFFFYAFALMAVVGALLTITRRSAVHSAIALIVSLLGVAGLFLLQQAEFLFVAQIVLYIGGIMVLFLFVIMLVNLQEEAARAQFNRQWPLVAGCLVGVAGEIAWLFRRGPEMLPVRAAFELSTGEPAVGNTERIADVLFSQYLLPFEVASLLLLVAVVGSVLMAKPRKGAA